MAYIQIILLEVGEAKPLYGGATAGGCITYMAPEQRKRQLHTIQLFLQYVGYEFLREGEKTLELP